MLIDDSQKRAELENTWTARNTLVYILPSLRKNVNKQMFFGDPFRVGFGVMKEDPMEA